MPPTARLIHYAPKIARYLLTALSDNLPNARRMAFTAPLSATDGGAGGDFTVAIDVAGPSVPGVIQLAGQLGGSADAPDVRGLRATGPGSAALLTLGDVATGQVLTRVDTTVVGQDAVMLTDGHLRGDLAAGGHKVAGMADGVLTGDAATYGQLASMINGLDWQASVLGLRATSPLTTGLAAGSRYIATAAGGDWSGQAQSIAEWTGSEWAYTPPNKGFTANVEDEGVDYQYNGSSWISIGASIAHSGLLGLTAGDDHPQYQLRTEKDATNGYAGLSGGIVTKPIQGIRVLSSDPGSPGHGEVWIHSTDLKYQNDNGGGQLETVERQARLDINGGYAGLDSGGLVNRPVKAIRSASSGDPSGPGPGETWITGQELKFEDAQGTPVTQTVERQARRNQYNGYAGLDGGGRVADAQAPAKAAYIPGGSQTITPGDIGAVAKGGDGMTGDLGMGGNRVTGLADGVGPSDAATYGQVSMLLNGLDWQASVLDRLATSPSTTGLANGSRYIATAAGGDWSGHAQSIAQWNAGPATWSFFPPSKGFTANVEADGTDWCYNGSAWVSLGASIPHAMLLGLGTGNDHPQYQLGSDKNANGGYAGLDGGGRVADAHAPLKAAYLPGGSQTIAPADIGAAPSGRTVATGGGMTGGGDLSADRTVSIAAFTGLVSKDADPASTAYASGVTVISGASVDVGADGTLFPVHIRLPPAVDNTKLNIEVALTFSDNSTAFLLNTNNGASADFDLVTIADIMMGSLGASASNNGKRLQKITAQVHNITGSTFTADVGVFRVRAFALPRGIGTAL